MKKLWIFLIISVFTLTACSNNSDTTKKNESKENKAKETGVLNCSINSTNNDATINTTYRAHYNNNIVTVINSEEKITTTSTTAFNLIESQIKILKNMYSGIKGYSIEYTADNMIITTKSSIDYTKINSAELINIDSTISNILVDSKLKISNLKDLYASMGVTCN